MVVDSGNLLAVATSIRERWPEKRIVVAGDDDHQIENNPGREKGLAADEAASGVAIFPNFGARTARPGIHRLQRPGNTISRDCITAVGRGP